jgi:hypothetical protein
MSDANSFTMNGDYGDWNGFVEQMNEQFMEAVEANMEAQAEFVESWSEAVEEGVGDAEAAEGVQGYARAYETWMEAAEQMVERANDAAEGDDIDVEEFRDVWLNSANEAFKEVMSTSAFAAATGQTVAGAMEAKRQADDAAETTLHDLGLPTESDVQEVGDRLVELERRQHEVEQKLDRVLEHLDE